MFRKLNDKDFMKITLQRRFDKDVIFLLYDNRTNVIPYAIIVDNRIRWYHKAETVGLIGYKSLWTDNAAVVWYTDCPEEYTNLLYYVYTGNSIIHDDIIMDFENYILTGSS